MAIDFPNSPTTNEDYTVNTTTWTYDGAKWVLKTYNSLHAVPVTAMMLWANTTYPTGWLLADGSAISRTTYADLFAAIGTTYGVGDGSTTFNLPNMVSAGADSPNTIIKVTNSGALEPSVISHAANHTEGGSDVVSVTLNQVPSYESFRNLIINGNMNVSQRNGTTATTYTDGQYTLDRYKAGLTQASKFTITQSTTAPPGYTNSLLVTSSSAYTVVSSDEFEFFQPIEGNVMARLAWGTASAKPVTLSFWTRSSLTGTFGGDIHDNATNYTYTFSYTISVANTWEYKTIYIVGPTSGSWGTGTGIGGNVLFNFGAGSSRTIAPGAWNTGFKPAPTGQTSIVGTNGATWYITGVQLEAGAVATPFEFEPFETTLRKCLRYYSRYTGYDLSTISGLAYATTNAFILVRFTVDMLKIPTITASSPASAFTLVSAIGNPIACNVAPYWHSVGVTPKGGMIVFTVASGMAAGNCTFCYTGTAYIEFSAEL